jgi:hypothetical protein
LSGSTHTPRDRDHHHKKNDREAGIVSVNLRERLESDLKQAMKARDRIRVETIRGVRNAVRNREIEVGEKLDDDGVVRAIRGLVKQRQDSIEQFRAGDRADLAEKETAEKAILEAYLPAAPSEEDLLRVVREVIAETGAAGPKDLGRVMKPALERLGPAADGKAVSALVRRLLTGD